MNLSDPIEKLPLVGPTFSQRLEKLNIKNISDLLYHFPFRYDDYSLISPIVRVQPGETLTIVGKVEAIKNEYTRLGKKIQKATVSDNSGKIEVIWFNQPYLVKTIKPGETYSFAGKIDWFGRQKVMISPEYELTKGDKETIHTGKLVPIYPETAGISSKWLRARIKTALGLTGEQIEEFLPSEIIKKEDLLPEKLAIEQINFPKNRKLAQKAKYRLGFDELFLIQLSALLRKKEWQMHVLGKQFLIDFEQSLKFIENLPFSLTFAQKRCLKEILLDLQKSTPMNRLLQGDVGSGKTVVATLAAFMAYLNQSLTLFMAPTEILANQHYQTLKSFLEPLGVPIWLITGSQKIRQNDKGVVVGTHALLYQEFNPETVGLVIVDEQHRFGVEQRRLLSQKGKAPHFLTMTATPIPRTVALIMYQDLDLSVIDEAPPGRLKVKTWVVPNQKRKQAYDWIHRQTRETDAQAFIICPLIEESETLSSVRAATKEYETLKKEIFPDLKLGLLHGRMKSKEKDKVLSEFKEGKTNILVATPVVEVGIDIPRATIMLVEGADRFGLAQLHQLRGRVGRSNIQSYCFLFTENESSSIINRLKSLEKTYIGMELAEIDLKLRGPGEIYGTKQHGWPNLTVASFTDLNLIQKSRAAAEEILNFYPQFLSSVSPLQTRLKKYKISLV